MLPVDGRAALEAHVAGCADCRQAREALAAAAAAWKSADAAAGKLDVEKAWHAIRREIRAQETPSARRRASWMTRALWAGVPMAAAAAVAVAVWSGTPSPIGDSPALASASWAQYVEVNDAAATPVVFVDQASGWVVVWASESEGGQT